MTQVLLANLVVMVLAMVIGVPVIFALLGAALVFYLVHPDLSTLVMVQQVQTSLQSYPLLAILFFILAGSIMAQGGIAHRIIKFADVLVGHWRGGLAQVCVVNSFIIGGMSGSAIADAAIDSKVLVPQMRKHGYSLGFSTAVSAASSAIAPCLPPSISLVIFGLLTNTSISRLFLAGIVPAVLTGIVLMITVYILARRRGYGALRGEKAPFAAVIAAARECFWALMMPVLLLLGLRAGIFTVTELSAMAVAYALLVSVVIYRSLSFKDIVNLFRETAKTTATIMLIIASSSAFSYAFALEQIPERAVSALSLISDRPFVILILINIVFLLLGMVVEGAAIVVLTAPVLVSIAQHYHIDPVLIGILVNVNLTIGTLHPPVGAVSYTVCAITGCNMAKFALELWPFLIALLAVLILLLVFPQFVLFLPNLVYP